MNYFNSDKCNELCLKTKWLSGWTPFLNSFVLIFKDFIFNTSNTEFSKYGNRTFLKNEAWQY